MWRCSVKSSRRLPPLFRPFWLGWSGGRRPKARLKLRFAGLLCAMILALSGCASLAQPTSNTATTSLPIRPVLTSLKITDEGGIMMDKRDAAELMIYIEALELAAGMVQ